MKARFIPFLLIAITLGLNLWFFLFYLQSVNVSKFLHINLMSGGFLGVPSALAALALTRRIMKKFEGLSLGANVIRPLISFQFCYVLCLVMLGGLLIILGAEEMVVFLAFGLCGLVEAQLLASIWLSHRLCLNYEIKNGLRTAPTPKDKSSSIHPLFTALVVVFALLCFWIISELLKVF